ncbi:MAG: hypothetical protein C4527_09810 [Candidatus Omnitrophota bacterium]|jgi:hypothetical protein|nr:MAG: hypothetical protein C4527_09810 [Candidatus Omnitrophota bacterium]
MNASHSESTFADVIFQRLDPQIRSSLTDAQIAALTKTLTECGPLKKHPVNLRGTIPLFFVRLYFVFLMGIDQRHSSGRSIVERRMQGISFGRVLFFLGTWVILIVILLFLLYHVKSAMGIDLFPDKHLYDFYNGLKSK